MRIFYLRRIISRLVNTEGNLFFQLGTEACYITSRQKIPKQIVTFNLNRIITCDLH